MSGSVGGVVGRADDVVAGLGHAPSTLWQYRWAWSQFESFCSREGADEITDDVVASFLRFVAEEHRQGRIKDWKRKLLRKSALVLAEVAVTGSYRWRQSRRSHPNDVLNVAFRPVQEQFEAWLADRVFEFEQAADGGGQAAGEPGHDIAAGSMPVKSRQQARMRSSSAAR